MSYRPTIDNGLALEDEVTGEKASQLDEFYRLLQETAPAAVAPEFAVRVGTLDGDRYFGPLSEAQARKNARDSALAGYQDVGLLRRETPDAPWVAVAWTPPSRLVSTMGKRPYSHWKR